MTWCECLGSRPNAFTSEDIKATYERVAQAANEWLERCAPKTLLKYAYAETPAGAV
jgi:hypothetical protein